METKELAKLGDKIISKKFNFEKLKPLRTYIKSCCKSIPRLAFIDEIRLFYNMLNEYLKFKALFFKSLNLSSNFNITN